MLDVSVYNTGLRMIGAPKHKRCRCTVGTDCSLCNNARITFDKRVYKMALALRDGVRDEAWESHLNRNALELIRLTSVRSFHCDTPGFKPYPGAPELPSTDRRRKRSLAGDVAKLPATFRRSDATMALTSSRLDVLRQMLRKHYDGYANTYVSEVRQYKKQLRVLLQGEYSTYCLNKQDFHKSNRVYMIIKRSSIGTETYMKCFCPCAVARGGGAYKIPCKEFTSRSIFMEPEHIKGFFGDEATPSKSHVYAGDAYVNDLEAKLVADGIITTDDLLNLQPC